MIKESTGLTLIELIVALAIISIVCSSFLNIQLSFSKANQISRHHLTAGSTAGNLYEKAKGMTIPEFAAWASKGTIIQDGILYRLETERFFSQPSHNNVNCLDLVITENSSSDYICYCIGDSILEVCTFTGNGLLQVYLSADDNHTKLNLTNEDGIMAKQNFIAEEAVRVVNIHTHGIAEDQGIIIQISNSNNLNWAINVYEKPFNNCKIEVHTEKQIINTKQIWQTYQEDKLLLSSIKSENAEGIPTYLQINAFQRETDELWKSNPISRREGVFFLMTK